MANQDSKTILFIDLNDVEYVAHPKYDQYAAFLSMERLSTGAPNEDIIQNHLNIALLNVSYYLNGR